MTSQTYQADDDQLIQEHDQPVRERDVMEPDTDLATPDADPAEPDADPAEPDADLAEPDADLAEPDADLAEPDADLAEPDADLAVAEAPLAEAEAAQTAHKDSTWHPADAGPLADHESAEASLPDYPAFTPDGDDTAEEQGTAGSSPVSPSLASVAFSVPESVTESNLAGNAASAGGPWNEIQALFVDDPRASIERAAGLVDNRVEAFIQSVTERQRSLQSARQVDDAGTEELRVALQHYRTFWNSLEDLPDQF
jgi:hypothetical protein